ncbi:unnamed protein product [Rotaria sp. Silwood1]|nr:unnamed protein product [Rotaria sp. Silwood1]CAF1275783.1 unnamed protein product [Rotaria sp. Silwood1]CAF1351152.1 unnamed protein product [Rotaria sp. Silwood1]CAF3484256.1 unnamed protein product [Rotaria sp. Silwood1]CAF3493897.1 unnamed protein product [Rotaria sp. Silwood1]
MSELLLTSSNDSFESSFTENTNETFDSYSLLFDKAKHNFSTSSEISFIKHDSLPLDQNQTVTKETLTTINDPLNENSINFNPWFLLFTQDNEQQQTVSVF